MSEAALEPLHSFLAHFHFLMLLHFRIESRNRFGNGLRNGPEMATLTPLNTSNIRLTRTILITTS